MPSYPVDERVADSPMCNDYFSYLRRYVFSAEGRERDRRMLAVFSVLEEVARDEGLALLVPSARERTDARIAGEF